MVLQAKKKIHFNFYSRKASECLKIEIFRFSFNPSNGWSVLTFVENVVRRWREMESWVWRTRIPLLYTFRVVESFCHIFRQIILTTWITEREKREKKLSVWLMLLSRKCFSTIEWVSLWQFWDSLSLLQLLQMTTNNKRNPPIPHEKWEKSNFHIFMDANWQP